MNAHAVAAHEPLRPVPGFESTAYAYRGKRIVWAGQGAAKPHPATQHPRHAFEPWQPTRLVIDTRRLRAGAQLALEGLDPGHANGALRKPSGDRFSLTLKGLLLWLKGEPVPFPLTLAQGRFDAIRLALEANDLVAFEAAALRVLGLGLGLTPSGDDFVGGIFFALAHAPRDDWAHGLPRVQVGIRQAAQSATNVISAALLDDLMDGASYRLLHELLAAFQSYNAIKIEASCAALMDVGASSGADMLAGVLLAVTTAPSSLTAGPLNLNLDS